MKTWVVGSNDRACDHPREALRHVGDDGKNGYYQCGRCGAIVIAEDELVRVARASQERSDYRCRSDD